MPARRLPTITLTTDFGEADHFVAALKGVILSICPAARAVDITHQITPFQVAEAAFVIAQAYPWFPRGTVHVAVVDPGVGTARRPILVEAAGQYFVGPDNGVFSMLEPRRVRHLTQTRYFLKNLSQTFHGRDIFAPVAAHLAAQGRPARFGPVIQDFLRSAAHRPVRTGKRYWAGTILKVDRFGNLITNIRPEDVPEVLTRPFSLVTGITPVERLISNYAEAPAGEPAVIVGSSGFLEVVVNQGSAARQLGCTAGSPVELMLL